MWRTAAYVTRIVRGPMQIEQTWTWERNASTTTLPQRRAPATSRIATATAGAIQVVNGTRKFKGRQGQTAWALVRRVTHHHFRLARGPCIGIGTTSGSAQKRVRGERCRRLALWYDLQSIMMLIRTKRSASLTQTSLLVMLISSEVTLRPTSPRSVIARAKLQCLHLRRCRRRRRRHHMALLARPSLLRETVTAKNTDPITVAGASRHHIAAANSSESAAGINRPAMQTMATPTCHFFVHGN